MMRRFLNRGILLMVVLMITSSCCDVMLSSLELFTTRSLDKNYFAGVYINEHDMNRGAMHYLLLNKDGTYFHKYDDSIHENWDFSDYISLDTIGTWNVESTYDIFFRACLGAVGRCQTLFHLGSCKIEFSEDCPKYNFVRIDTIRAIDLGILPKECVNQ